MRQVLGGGHHLDHPQPGGGGLVDVVARLPAQLSLIRTQVAEQDAGLSLADVQAGEFPKTLRVIAPITNGDMDFELARILADRLQGYFFDRETEVVESTNGPLDSVAIVEAVDGFGVEQFPQQFVADLNLLGFADLTGDQGGSSSAGHA